MSLLARLYKFDLYEELFWKGKNKLQLRPSSFDEFIRRTQWNNATDIKITVTTHHNDKVTYYENGRQFMHYRHKGLILMEAEGRYKFDPMGIEMVIFLKRLPALKLMLEESSYSGQPHTDDIDFYKWADEIRVTIQERLPTVKLRMRYPRRKES